MATILSSKPVKRRSCLGMQGFEVALPVARDINPERPVVGQHGLAGGAVAVVAYRVRLVGAGWVTQVMAEFGAQDAFN
jgi:hypothetical protein